ncbi:MAG: hypothetical protein AAB699_00855 [Patescibacteria group bacterium]
MSLHIPKEPQEVKAWIAHLESLSGPSTDIKWENLNVWYGNKLPQYLWHEWKNELKPQGFTWQKFSRLLRMRTDKMVGWFKGLNSWQTLAEDIRDLLESPLGQDIAKK